MEISDRFIFFEVFYNQGKRVRVNERGWSKKKKKEKKNSLLRIS